MYRGIVSIKSDVAGGNSDRVAWGASGVGGQYSECLFHCFT